MQTVKVFSVDPETKAATLTVEVQNLVEHPLYLESDVDYYRKKGFSLSDILKLWQLEMSRIFS